MFKKIRTAILKVILKEFSISSITGDDSETHIILTEPFNNKKGYKEICIDIYEYGTYEDLYPEAYEDDK